MVVHLGVAEAINLGDTDLGVAMVSAISSTTAWAVGYPTVAGKQVVFGKLLSGGSYWTTQNTASYNSSGSFTNVVHFWDENYGFAQGDPIGGEYELYVTSDGGNNWEAVPGEIFLTQVEVSMVTLVKLK